MFLRMRERNEYNEGRVRWQNTKEYKQHVRTDARIECIARLNALLLIEPIEIEPSSSLREN